MLATASRQAVAEDVNHASTMPVIAVPIRKPFTRIEVRLFWPSGGLGFQGFADPQEPCSGTMRHWGRLTALKP